MLRYEMTPMDVATCRFGISPLNEMCLSLRSLRAPGAYASRVAESFLVMPESRGHRETLLALVNDEFSTPDVINPRPESPSPRLAAEPDRPRGGPRRDPHGRPGAALAERGPEGGAGNVDRGALSGPRRPRGLLGLRVRRLLDEPSQHPRGGRPAPRVAGRRLRAAARTVRACTRASRSTRPPSAPATAWARRTPRRWAAGGSSSCRRSSRSPPRTPTATPPHRWSSTRHAVSGRRSGPSPPSTPRHCWAGPGPTS